MPFMTEQVEPDPVKMLLLGNSGSGKTGSLASLAEAGYILHILDFDRGTAILRNLLRGKPGLARVEVEMFQDLYKNAGPQVYASKVEAWSKAMNTVTKWTSNPEYQTQDHILVIDSLNFATKVAFNWILQSAGRLMAPKEIQDWGAAQDLVGNFLMKLYSNEVKCHTIVCTHISYQGSGDNDIKVGYPMTSIGRSFNPQVARYFNSCVMARNTGTGIGNKREIYTHPIDFVDLKTEALTVKKSYGLATGMAELFADIRGTSPELGTQVKAKPVLTQGAPKPALMAKTGVK